MNMQGILLSLVGAIVSVMVAIVLIWYSKKTISKTMSRRHILNTLRNRSMDGKELIDSAKESSSPVLSPKLIPMVLIKLQEEGLIQRMISKKYAITTKGVESLEDLNATSREFQKIAKIVERMSSLSKFMISEAIDRVTILSEIEDVIDEKPEQSESKTANPYF